MFVSGWLTENPSQELWRPSLAFPSVLILRLRPRRWVEAVTRENPGRFDNNPSLVGRRSSEISRSLRVTKR